MNGPLTHLSEPAKHVGDVISVGSVAAIFLNLLPHLTAVLAFIWLVMRIIESRQTIRLNSIKLLTLRQVYDATLKEPVPDRLTEVMKKLDEKE